MRTVSLTGQLLVATPELREPTFARTVLLVVDHDDEGALGVVLNRPTDDAVDQLAPPLAAAAARPGRVFGGGPVQRDVVMCLSAGRDDALCAWSQLDPDDPPELPGPLRVFRGYAGWAPGQLETELAATAWWVVAPQPRDLFTSEPERLWREVLRRQGPPLAYASTYLADPALN